MKENSNYYSRLLDINSMEERYNQLLNDGKLLTIYPHLSGDWNRDKRFIYQGIRDEIEILDDREIPTKWSSVREIETWVGGNPYDGTGGRAKLTVIHHCGDNKEDLIDQLETMIYGLKNGFEDFAN